MVHISCDLCGKDLGAAGDRRFVVKITAYAKFDPNEIKEDDLDEDHMEVVSEILRSEADDGTAGTDDEMPIFKGFRFDLCPACHAKFVKDPLGRDLLRSLDFSPN